MFSLRGSFLLLLALKAVSVNAARPAFAGNMSFALTCELEIECPPKMFCYDGLCDCYGYYGHTGDDCQESSAAGQLIMLAALLTSAVFQQYQNFLTLYQLKKCDAFKAGTPAGTVLLACCSSTFFEACLLTVYLLVTIGADPDYTVNDTARPLIFGMLVIGKLTGMFAIPIMWMEIVVKSPGNNSDENKKKYKQLTRIIHATTIISSSVVFILLLLGKAALVSALFVLILLMLLALYQIASRKLAIMICKNFWELGLTPSEDKFSNNAEKSGHKAAKNIIVVSNRVFRLISAFICFLLVFSRTVKQKSIPGIVPFLGVNGFVAICLMMEGICRNYVRLGSQKKLQKGGFGVGRGMFGMSKVTALTTTAMSSTTVEQSSVDTN
ncbi:hypothetical protein TrLO_g12362 [Triparma laevis f. longispina]|uniref:EGF-like domain-containing protein n=1 Tax=Triparma laevis f. longispina TaxID=1714387 RepID=A0A9W7FBJ9_9STRA|nr:hypothetical protein TrLO_g12362 [Triparma laevis f. longispina]